MKSIIGIGIVGFDGLPYFESNFSNVTGSVGMSGSLVAFTKKKYY